MRQSALDQLTRTVKGAVLTPKSAGFAPASSIFNVAQASRPAVIVQCADDADVMTAVKFAREHDLPLTTRGAGNALTGHSLVASGLVIDLRNRREVFVRDGLLTAGGGATWGEVLALPGAHGVTTGTFDRRVGVGGSTLGAGFGAATRLLGLCPDTLVSADVVTADGHRCLTTSATQSPDLFWALRGAGANFGVVTRFQFQLTQVPPLVFGSLAFPIEAAAEVLRVYRDLALALADETTVYATMTLEKEHRELRFLVFHFGDQAGAERAVRPLLLSRPLQSSFSPVPYAAVHQENRTTFPADHGHAWRAHFLDALEDGVLDAVLDYVDQATYPQWIVFEHLGGAVGRLKRKDTAFAHRSAQFGFVTTLKWPGAARKPAAALAKQEALHAKLRRHSLGSYVNYIPRDYTRGDVALAYGANLPRLRKLKAKYDPDNVFRQNINITPAR